MANFCPECGARTTPGDFFCKNCGHSLVPRQAQQPPPVYVVGPTHEQMQERKQLHKSQGVAFILTIFLTGLGQVYIGQAAKGAGIFISVVLLDVYGFYLLFTGFSSWALLFFFIVIIIWIVALADLHSQVNKYNDYIDRYGKPPW